MPNLKIRAAICSGITALFLVVTWIYFTSDGSYDILFVILPILTATTLASYFAYRHADFMVNHPWGIKGVFRRIGLVLIIMWLIFYGVIFANTFISGVYELISSSFKVFYDSTLYQLALKTLEALLMLIFGPVFLAFLAFIFAFYIPPIVIVLTLIFAWLNKP